MNQGINIADLVKIHDWLWEIPKNFRSGMQVPARVYASEKMLNEILADRSLEQLVNVAALPGIQKYALAMPDIHEGYGFPIGGVAAFDAKEGIISPGGISYDINCGVRLLRSNLTIEEVRPRLKELGRAIYREVPSGVGRGGRLKLKGKDLDEVLKEGAQHLVELGYGKAEDLKHLEQMGRLEEAQPELVSETAKSRGQDQLGTMGAGNHFVEVEQVEKIFDKETAAKLGLFENQIIVLIHTGSRGLGHQVASDYVRIMVQVMPKYKITLPNRELACAPFRSKEGQNYWQAMAAAANFAWGNRQLITFEVRKAWQDTLGQAASNLDIVYDVSHNIAKLESGFIVHRKGATRSFPGQPVLIPGSMGTFSYVLVGQEQSLKETFGSSCHGAGRRMSRSKAKREIRGSELKKELLNKGIVINAGSLSGLAEEAPQAYKDVNEVVNVVQSAGIARKVARLKPLAVIKG